jgi:hypothetical protein
LDFSDVSLNPGRRVFAHAHQAERNLPMKRLAASIILVAVLTGCRGSQPDINLLAPYGSSRVPAPSTNSVGAGNSYYDRTAPPKAAAPANQPSATTPASSAPATTQQTPQRTNVQSPYFAADGVWKPANAKATATQGAAAEVSDSQVRPVSFTTPSGEGKAAATPTTTTASLQKPKLRLNGMPVTDATRLTSSAEPARFTPPENLVEISQLPRVAEATQPSDAGSAVASGTVVSSAKSSDKVTPATANDATSESTLNWKSRPGN